MLRSVMGMEFFAQAIGIVAMVVTVASFQFKSKRWLLLFQSLGSALFAVNLILLGGITGGLLNIVGTFRGILFMYVDRFRNHIKPVIGGFLCLYVLSYILTFTVFGKDPTVQNLIIEVFPVISMTAMTFGFAGKDAKTVRVCGFINSPCWLIYNCFNLAIGAILCEVFSLVSLISAVIRLDIKHEVKR